MCRTRDSRIGEAFLGGGETFLDCGGGDRPRLAPSAGLLLRGGGLRLPELALREGDEEEEDKDRERDLERDTERERELERESEPE